MSLKVGSLFSGIGGLDLGLVQAGLEIAWQVEIDEYCQTILKKHFPQTVKHDNILTFPQGNLKLWKVDVLAGGFPCQDVSQSSIHKNVGLDGARSGLWFEYKRVIDLIRPKYVLIENVMGLFNNGFQRVIHGLAASGYTCEWDIMAASQFGLHHRRKRIFILAYPASFDVDGEKDGRSGYFETVRQIKKGYKSKEKFILSRGLSGGVRPFPSSGIRTMDYGISSRLSLKDYDQRIKALGNAVIPAEGLVLGKALIEFNQRFAKRK